MATKSSMKASPVRPLEAERRDVEWVPISALLLDPDNPRLPDGMENATQAELLGALARDYDLEDLGQSLADNGYFAEEPLVVIRAKKPNTWTVVEGNRRLAAIKLLESPSAAPKPRRPVWTKLSIERLKKIGDVPILEYSDRQDIIPYLGFRHITGVLSWRPYQKAKYISQLVEKSGFSFSQIARTIGSKIPTVREHYVAYTLTRQARDEFVIDTSYAEDAFGVLRRSLSDPDIRTFIGLDIGKPEKQLLNPLPRAKANSIKEFFVWAFGDSETAAVIRESRDLKKLGTVLASNKGIEVLRSSSDLDRAFELSGGEQAKLIESLTTASYHLDQALPLAIRHTDDKNVVAAVAKVQQDVLRDSSSFP